MINLEMEKFSVYQITIKCYHIAEQRHLLSVSDTHHWNECVKTSILRILLFIVFMFPI